MSITEAALHYFDVMGWKPIWVELETSVSYPWSKKGYPDRDGVVREFNAHPNHRIAVLTGAVSGIVVIDPDSKNGLKKGPENLAALIAQNGDEWPLTLTATTKTGGKHYIFRHPGEGVRVPSRPLPGCADVDVKGDGGNIKVFPSPGYKWDDHTVPIAEMPGWLAKLVVSKSVQADAPRSPVANPLSPDELAATVSRCESYLQGVDPDVDEPVWRMVGASVHQATRAAPEGLALFDRWSSKGAKYDSAAVQAKWSRFELDRPEGSVGEGYLQTLNPWPQIASGIVFSDGAAIQPPPLHPEPIDLFGKFAPPSLPGDLLPPVIFDYANAQGELMGVDPGGVAMAAMTVCAAAIPDSIILKVKRHEDWYETARVWTALVGDPSSKKSPIIRKVAKPLTRIDAKLMQKFMAEKAEYEALPKEEKAAVQRPKMERLRTEDVTIEAMQEILKDNEHGVLCLQDELSGWFGSMDKYSGARGSAKDRGFWLQSFNGGPAVVDRVTRGTGYIPNLSVSLLGGIQPSAIRKTMADAVDDGLVQRLFPIILKPAGEGQDVEVPPVVEAYENLIERLYAIRVYPGHASLMFDDGAHAIRQQVERRHFELQATEAINPKLASHFGKLDGMFARLCVLWHCIENAGTPFFPSIVTEATARRVDEFMRVFLLRHSYAFYTGTLGMSDDQDAVTATAGYILSRGLTEITSRDMARGDTVMKSLEPAEVLRTFERLSALGWMEVSAGPRPTSPARGSVNPRVHQLFADRAEAERTRRENVRKIMMELAA